MTWALPQKVSYKEFVRKIFSLRQMDPNEWKLQMIIRWPHYKQEYNIVYCTLFGMNNDAEMSKLWNWNIEPKLAKKRDSCTTNLNEFRFKGFRMCILFPRNHQW